MSPLQSSSNTPAFLFDLMARWWTVSINTCSLGATRSNKQASLWLSGAFIVASA